MQLPPQLRVRSRLGETRHATIETVALTCLIVVLGVLTGVTVYRTSQQNLGDKVVGSPPKWPSFTAPDRSFTAPIPPGTKVESHKNGKTGEYRFAIAANSSILVTVAEVGTELDFVTLSNLKYSDLSDQDMLLTSVTVDASDPPETTAFIGTWAKDSITYAIEGRITRSGPLLYTVVSTEAPADGTKTSAIYHRFIAGFVSDDSQT